MANKRYDEFGAGTYDTSKIFLQADPVTGALEKVNLPAVVPYYNETIAAYQVLGSQLKAQTLGYSINNFSSAGALVNQRLRFACIYLPVAASLTGAAFYQSTTGNFTGNNFNGLGLYTPAAGVLTRVALTANDPNIWKGAVNTVQKIPWTAPYNASAGLYYVAFLYCNSAQVTAPGTLESPTNFNAAMQKVDLTNSSALTGWVSAQTALTTPVNMSSFFVPQQTLWAALY